MDALHSAPSSVVRYAHLIAQAGSPVRPSLNLALGPDRVYSPPLGDLPLWTSHGYSTSRKVRTAFTSDKFATLGAALRLKSGARVLDLGSGSGEMLCTWARDHGIIGTGIDMSPLFTEQAKQRAEELGVAHQVRFIHDDAAGYVSDEKVDVAACVGATWIGGGVAGTIELLTRSLGTGGIILIGEPYWRQVPPTEEVAKGCLANAISDFLSLPELIASFGNLGYDVVEMVLANQDGWDRYEAAKWLTMRRWLEANPDDELAEEVRSKLVSEPERHATYTREYLGWGVFALMPRFCLKNA